MKNQLAMDPLAGSPSLTAMPTQQYAALDQAPSNENEFTKPIFDPKTMNKAQGYYGTVQDRANSVDFDFIQASKY
jgi:hypothetical protein